MDLKERKCKVSCRWFSILNPSQFLLLCILAGSLAGTKSAVYANAITGTEKLNSNENYKNSTGSSGQSLFNVTKTTITGETTGNHSSSSSSSDLAGSGTSIVSTQKQSSVGESSRHGREVGSSTTESTTTTTTNPIRPPSLPKAEAYTANDAPQEKLKKALLNHSHHLHDMNGEDLDQLVFSQLPQGSKLILRSVKIVRTDDNGNEADSGEEATEWDVLLRNGTPSSAAPSIVPNSTPRRRKQQQEQQHVTREHGGDMIGASSHSEAHYDSEGSNLRNKQRDNKYYHNRDHGQLKKQTITDTDGTKVKNYDGSEKGVTDFAHSHGNSQSNEGGRYKDSKKKNKGRKVTGFKRVYHKEEFQRTEHFYDDEEAKRIAESFGQKDEKEKSEHGVKDDDRKYDGVHKENTDGHKVKNEHGTYNSYDKGHHQSQKDSERHQAAQNFANRQRTGPLHGNHQHHHHLRGRPRHYENHNYEGASSNHGTKLTRKPTTPTTAEILTTILSSTTAIPETAPSATDLDTEAGPPPRHIRKFPRRRPHKKTPTVNSGNNNNNHDNNNNIGSTTSANKPSFAMTAPLPALSKPPDMKTFFSPRHRHFPYSADDLTMAYAPNFAPPSEASLTPEKVIPFSYSYSFRTIHPMKSPHGNKGTERRNNETKTLGSSTHYTRYAGDFPVGNMADPIPQHYSTLTSTLPNIINNYPPARGNLISIEKSKGLEYSGSSHTESIPTSTGHYIEPAVPTVIQTGPSNMIHHHPMPSYPKRPAPINWIPLGHGSNNHNTKSHYPPPRSPSNAIPSSYPGFSFNPLRIGKTLIPNMFLRHPQSTVSPMVAANYRPRPAPSSSSRPSHPGSLSPHGSPSSVHYSKRNPQFSQFMNGLMDSVAGFFGRMG